MLLIVPYGIETTDALDKLKENAELLIVPYGIETLDADILFNTETLLIVPYGIETLSANANNGANAGF